MTESETQEPVMINVGLEFRLPEPGEDPDAYVKSLKTELEGLGDRVYAHLQEAFTAFLEAKERGAMDPDGSGVVRVSYKDGEVKRLPPRGTEPDAGEDDAL